MKTFEKYLTEAKKTYKFKFGIAGELPEGFADGCESCLQKFGLVNMSPGKKTPIQKRPLDFPKLQNVETHYFEVELSYPTRRNDDPPSILDLFFGSSNHFMDRIRSPSNPE